MNEPLHGAPGAPEGRLLVDEVVEQLNRTRDILLLADPEAAALRALGRTGREGSGEARLAALLAIHEPLAHPGHFGAAHRTVLRALEVLDAEGASAVSGPRIPIAGPLLAGVVERVVDYIVGGFTAETMTRLRDLYALREAQAAPGTAERHELARARADVDRLKPAFAGGGKLPLALTALLLPLAGSLTGVLPGFDGLAGTTLLVLFIVGAIVSGMAAAVLIRGAGVAHRRCRLAMGAPLEALWETLGGAGSPPRDQAVRVATMGMVLTLLGWVVFPAAAAVVSFL